MVQAYVPSVDSVIWREVTSLVFCTLDDLAQRLSDYSWAQVFAAVDRLSRQGTLRLSRTNRFGYVLSVGSVPLLPHLRQTEGVRGRAGETAESPFAKRKTFRSVGKRPSMGYEQARFGKGRSMR
ncbi:MAG TPA: hypothetical protein VJU54_06145 [Nitrospiraceae bacterium]|nr:hypothetical protein [Nitrospiraceae bacterium]